ncbi:hypothetical protein F2Q69_00023102 [Brassica cretica]|uniref:Uncharacterized protein n=1 Tax=Brassica cretica TaxID=69181 RepID=A0A8S9QJF2_BRACR|nr:hypothetical protein F2Q69_00023102 [Brassica cretica]
MALALPLLYIPDDADYEFMTHGGQTSGEVGQRTVESSPTPRRVTEMGKKLAERIRKQRTLHCPDCSLNVLKTGVLMIMCLIFVFLSMDRLKQKKFSFLLQSFPNLKTLVWEKTVSLIIKELLPSADKYCYKLPDQRYE